MLPRIQILSTGEFLVLSTKGLSVAIRSTLFQNQDDLIGSISYPGTMPIEDNRAKIANAHIINTDASLRTFMVRVWLGSIPWKLAKLNFIIKGNEISYTLYIDVANVAVQLKTLMLNNLPDDPNYVHQPLNNAADVAAFMNATVTAPPGTSPVVFFPYKNDGAYKEIDPSDYGSYPAFSLPYDIFFNSWSISPSGEGSFIVQSGSAPQKQTQTPFFYLVYVLKRIVKYLGYTPVGKWLEDENALRIVIDSNRPAFINTIFADFSYYMPEITLADFLTEVRTRWGLLIDFNELDGICIIEHLDNLITGDDIIDLRDEQMISFEELSTSLRAYTITEGVDDKDLSFTDMDKANLPVLKIGDANNAVEVTDIQLKSVATIMITENGPTWSQSAAWKIPWIKRQIYGTTPFDQISEIEYGDRNKFALRFLYYHGLQKSAEGFLYPYGSSDNLDVSGKPLTNFSLALNAPKGSKVLVQRYYDFIKNSKPFQMGFALKPLQFLSLTPKRRVLVREPVTQATIACLLDEVNADLGNQETVLAKATLYPILIPVNQVEVIPVVPPVIEPPFDNGVVYIRLVKRNEVTEFANNPPPPHSSSYADFYIQCFADAAATIPKDVTRLSVRVKISITYSAGSPGSNGFTDVSCTSVAHEALLFGRAFTGSSSTGLSTSYTYQLASSTLYTILP